MIDIHAAALLHRIRRAGVAGVHEREMSSREKYAVQTLTRLRYVRPKTSSQGRVFVDLLHELRERPANSTPRFWECGDALTRAIQEQLP